MRNLLPPTLPNSPQAIEHELDLLASEISMPVEPEELLRKPKSQKQGARFPDREEAFKDEARRQAAGRGRNRFGAPTPVPSSLRSTSRKAGSSR